MSNAYELESKDLSSRYRGFNKNSCSQQNLELTISFNTLGIMLTILILPLYTTANAPCPIKSFDRYS